MAVFLELDDVPIEEPWVEDGDDSRLEKWFQVGVPLAEEKRTPSQTIHLTQAKPLFVPFRRLVKPGAVGKDVIAYKRALSVAGYMRWPSDGRWTRLYGTFMKKAVQSFQSHHDLRADAQIGPATHAKLAHFFDRYGAYLLMQAPIKKKATGEDKVRAHIQASCWLTIHNAWAIHYTQGPSRMEGVRRRLHSPMFGHWEDCSSIYSWWCFDSGLQDPNGFMWRGWGFTGTLGSHNPHVSAPKVGDGALYGHSPWRHVTCVIGFRRGEPLVASHGSEIGPIFTHAHYRGDLDRYFRPRGLT